MTFAILRRYEKTDQGHLAVDVSISNYEELYNEWDNSASYLKKDLDDDFTDYLYECFDEIAKYKPIIRIRIRKRDTSKEQRVKKSVRRYFEYMIARNVLLLSSHFRKTFYYALIGLSFITLSLVLSTKIHGLVGEILVEGMTIIGWVTMWQVVTGVLYDWIPLYRENTVYREITRAKIVFSKD